VHKYMYFYLTLNTMVAQLDQHSAEGWEFVAWIDPYWSPWSSNPTRSALFRRAVPQEGNTP
jgi:hypothetical protein